MASFPSPHGPLERPLTKIEVQKLITGLLAPLIDMADSVDLVYEAVAWFSSADPMAVQTWNFMREVRIKLREFQAKMAQQNSPLIKPD